MIILHKLFMNTNNICPYCNRPLPKPFTRSGKCPLCKEHIYAWKLYAGRTLMTKLESWYHMGRPFIKREYVRGNPRNELCICRECGKLDTYFWLLYINHFPLTCHFCGAAAVHMIDPDHLSESEIDSIENHADNLLDDDDES